MKIFKLNNHGLTLMETLAAVAISIVCLAVLLQLTLNNRTHKSEIDRSMVLKEILTNNVIEIKGAPASSLPGPGNCLVRIYNFQTEFQSESLQTSNANLCGTSEPEPNTIQVLWQVEPSSSIDATFSSPSLKLPRYSDAIKKVTLHVRGYSSGARSRLIHDQVTLFKR